MCFDSVVEHLSVGEKSQHVFWERGTLRCSQQLSPSCTPADDSRHRRLENAEKDEDEERNGCGFLS